MREEFIASLPVRPYCTNDPRDGMRIKPRLIALNSSHIQFNQPSVWRWMVFDVDCDDAYFRPEERGCPEPTFISVSRSSGHAHVGYLLESPITAFDKSSRQAMSFYEDVERGLTVKMGADRCYAGLICKNPTHSQWETDWMGCAPYDLARLNDCLDKSDKKKVIRTAPSGFGRNCTIFDEIRKWAYKNVIEFKRHRLFTEFKEKMEEVALRMNLKFQSPMLRQEVVGIVRSVSEWTWRRFSIEKFSSMQTHRINLRWAKYTPKIHTLKPKGPRALRGLLS